jgi:photosystem II stability/assembly factor-like uncharacterized protein
MRRFLLAFALLVVAAPLLAVEGQWSVLGPDGGPVNDLALQPGSDQVLYASVMGGLYKSRDAGATWAWSGSGLFVGSMTMNVAFDPVHPETTLYAAQGGAGLYKSVNGGQTWRYVGVPGAYQVAAHPRISGTVFAATGYGIFRTSNGVNWSRVSRGLPNSYVATLIAFDPTLERRLYAWIQDDIDAQVGNLARSTDGGATWQVLRHGPQRNHKVQALAIDPRTRATLYAGTDRAVYKSTDGGTTWRQTGLASGSVRVLKVHPRLGSVFAGTDAGLFRSDDGGVTWRRLSQGLEGTSTLALAFSPSSPQTLYAASAGLFERGGVFKSGDGGHSWAFSSHGISALGVESVAVDPADSNRLWVLANKVPFRSTDRGRTWERVRPGPGSGNSPVAKIVVDPADGSTVYLVLPDGTLRRTRDGGQTWETAGRLGGIPISGNLLYQGLQLVIDPQDPATLYAAGVGIAKSTDGGATWTLLPGDPSDLVFFDLAISPSSPTTLYGTGGGGQGGNRVVRTVDGGATWTREQQGLPGPLVRLAVDPHDARTVYGLFDSSPGAFNVEMFRTTDGGESWSLLDLPFNAPFDNKFFLALAFSPSGSLGVGVDLDNVYVTQDGGGSWEPLGTTAKEYYGALAFDPGDPCRIYVGTTQGLLAFTKSGPGCN